MIKFTIIFVIVYLVMAWFTKTYVQTLNKKDALSLYIKINSGRSIWFAFLGVMKIGAVVLTAISVILLVVNYL